MSDTEKRRKVLNDLLWRVLEQVGPILPDADRELIADFVDNYEFGVAVEWLEAVAKRLNLTIPEAAVSDLAKARKHMGMEN